MTGEAPGWSVFDFIVTASVIFILVKQVNRFKNEEAPASTAGPTNEEKHLMEIGDTLKGR